MKKILLVIITVVCLAFDAQADVFSHTFLFQEEDFSIIKANSDSLLITPLTFPAIYPDVTEPGVPLVGRNIALPEGYAAKSISVIFNERLIRSGVDVSNASYPTPTYMSANVITKKNVGYVPKIYPDSNCVLAKESNISGVNVMSFLLSPFIFDAKARNLYFIDSIQVNIELEANRIKKVSSQARQDQNEILRAIVENAYDLENVPAAHYEPNPEEIFEYVIITNESLKNAFQPLADWKQKKGVPSKIVTIEDINRNYSGKTQQIRIKSCIVDLYENHRLQFVLLGGDNNIIPSQPCYVNSFVPETNVTFYIDEEIPADVYYSSLYDIDWDPNNDGRVGEMSWDKIDVTPVIHVARAPVYDTYQTSIFVNRTIEYERSPKFTRSIFQGGASLNSIIKGETLGDMLFDEVFKDKIPMGTQRVYDTFMYNGKKFSMQAVSEELSNGYMLAEFISHGNETSLMDRFNNVYFNTVSASDLHNDGHTIFTTMACSTNAFDNPKLCLSEALFRNPNSGLIGYLGSSRLGWFNNQEPTLELSMGYEKIFYERLFDGESLRPYVKHLGALVTFTKSSFLPYLNQSYVYRWLHYSINVLGDPETPIYNTYPKAFALSQAEYDGEGLLVVDTGVENARVCVSSINDDSYYEIKYGKECVFDTGVGEFDVWITSQNYIPRNHIVKCTIIRDSLEELEVPTQIISITPNPVVDYVTIKYYTPLKNSILQVAFTNIHSSNSIIYDIANFNGEATINIENIPNGIYVVNLIENGIVISGNHRIIKQ